MLWPSHYDQPYGPPPLCAAPKNSAKQLFADKFAAIQLSKAKRWGMSQVLGNAACRVLYVSVQSRVSHCLLVP
jgi:hypothetical protein